MNLLLDPWIPARRLDGQVEDLAVWQLTQGLDEQPWVALELPRADLYAAALQFLVGVLQTCLAPEDEDAWLDMLEEPPTPEQLKEKLRPFAYAFELWGDGPRFMQDQEPLEEQCKAKDHKPVEQLLVDAPGDNTVKQNKDLFIKSSLVTQLGQEGAALALLALQIHAPSGGAGHRQSPRGGGPITTLLWSFDRSGGGVTLWENLWRNVLPLFEVDPEEREPFAHREQIFPWLSPTRTSAREDGCETTVADVHPLQIFWPTPRRIRLVPREVQGRCDILGRPAAVQVRSYVTTNYGVNYTGVWRHPLSPYSERINRQNEPYKVTTSTFGDLGYQHWLGLAQVHGGRQIKPAPVVQYIYTHRSEPALPGDSSLQLWSFGYDMDNMKARAWRDSRMPVLPMPPALREEMEVYTARLVEGAEQASFYMVQGLREAFSNRPSDLSLDAAFLSQARARFMAQTQASFFGCLGRLGQVVREGAGAEVVREVVDAWRKELSVVAEQLWDDLSQSGYFQAVDPARMARAYHALRGRLRSPKFYEALGLPVPESKKKTKKKKKAS